SAADAVIAVATCRDAAGALARTGAHTQALELLERAVALADQQPRYERAELLVEWAEAILACGRLADARAAFGRALDASTSYDQPELTARIALGLGGVWLNEQRDPYDRLRILSLQRSALDHLPPDESVLRTRLTVRLAAEAVYDGEPVAPVF